ncbi:DUF805 domain-containing protein [Pedobacter sp. AW31-3R]|uniref:DUF805 domain-containing protein n=1 Tax=Pedobacter sp. AW31-3R TaxID=3445781 RepID=UPI003F9F7EEB
MFQNPFSLKGRISRTEFWLSCFAYLGLISLFFMTMDKSAATIRNTSEHWFVVLILGPCLWLLFVQAVKRSHDIGKSGWLIMNPYYYYQLFFERGQPCTNHHGEDPRVVRLRSVIPDDDLFNYLNEHKRNLGRDN